MAQDLNSVCLVGNLTRDVGSDPNGRDFGYTQGGLCMATMSIASNSRKKGQDGGWEDLVSYFDVKLFGKTAENLRQYLVKGQKVAVEGVLRQDRWKTQDGRGMSRVYVIANSVQLLGGRQEAGFSPDTAYASAQAAREASSQAQQGYAARQPAPQQGGFPEDIPYVDSEGIPF